jgi:Raf kinase inhibitor-like YbhB/YbcL family protein
MLDLARKRWALRLAGLAMLGCAACTDPHPQPAKSSATPRLDVTSNALQPNAPIPAAYACTDDEHLGKSPPISWSKGPEGTVAYAVTVTDPDARNFVHWAVVGLPPGTTSLPEGASPGGALPKGAAELPNDFDKMGYGGPCPPAGAPHHYVIEVTALKAPVAATKPDAAFFQALDAAALARGSITVTFKR